MNAYIPKFTVPKAAPKEIYKPGLVSISFRNNTQREILTMMKTAGLSYIEWGSDVHAPHRSLGMLGELAQLQAQFGVSCCSYGTYFRLGETPTDELEYYISAAKRVSCLAKHDAEHIWIYLAIKENNFAHSRQRANLLC